MNREQFEKTEALIAELTADAQPKDIKLALYSYLLAVANGREPTELEHRAAAHFVALGLENVPPSVGMDKAKRRMYCADKALFVARLGNPAKDALAVVAAEFGISEEALHSAAKRSGLYGAGIEVRITGKVHDQGPKETK